MAPDPYETLGVSRTATAEEIKRAYRRLARREHPDANRHDPEAEDRFKDITRAYEVLSDPEKRRRFDTFGDERAGDGPFGGMGDFGNLSDLFSSFFGTGGTPGGRRGPARGTDILAEVEITLEEAAAGIEREVEFPRMGECPVCKGSGGKAGTYPSNCPDCNGTGELHEVRRTFFGNMMTAATCFRCGGSGRLNLDPCERCSGDGRVRVTESIKVGIPPGVDDGAQLRVSGRGEAGPRGGPTGNLYVAIRVAPHPVFKRAGEDLGLEVAVPMTVAALGGSVEVPTLDGHETIDVAPGTQSGEVVRLRNKGMPRLRGHGRGEIVIWLRVETPTALDDEQAELLARFAKLRSEDAGERGLFDRIKEAFH
jgi:molecular chaperone DnaJ